MVLSVQRVVSEIVCPVGACFSGSSGGPVFLRVHAHEYARARAHMCTCTHMMHTHTHTHTHTRTSHAHSNAHSLARTLAPRCLHQTPGDTRTRVAVACQPARIPRAAPQSRDTKPVSRLRTAAARTRAVAPLTAISRIPSAAALLRAWDTPWALEISSLCKCAAPVPQRCRPDAQLLGASVLIT